MSSHCPLLQCFLNLLKMDDDPSFSSCLLYLCYTCLGDECVCVVNHHVQCVLCIHFQNYNHENIGARVIGCKIGVSQSILFSITYIKFMLALNYSNQKRKGHTIYLFCFLRVYIKNRKMNI